MRVGTGPKVKLLVHDVRRLVQMASDRAEQRAVGGLARQDAEHRERVRALSAAIKAMDAAPQRSTAILASLVVRCIAAAREVVRGFE